jgi:hypothetical protein
MALFGVALFSKWFAFLLYSIDVGRALWPATQS